MEFMNTRPARAGCAMLLGLLAGTPASAQAQAQTQAQPQAPETTIVLIRHGEKPPGGLGQLDCQGLNRALALPAVIASRFGKPAAIFAPNPAIPRKDHGMLYSYIRPLATVEPTAIRFGMPVDLGFGADDWPALARHLLAAAPPGVVLIAWEHTNLVKLARAIVSGAGGAPGIVRDWDRADFDGMDVLHVSHGPASQRVRFEHLNEGLNGEPQACASK